MTHRRFNLSLFCLGPVFLPFWRATIDLSGFFNTFWKGINRSTVLPCIFSFHCLLCQATCCSFKAEKVPELLKVIEARPKGQEDEAMHDGATLVKWPGDLKQKLKDWMMA